MNMDELITRAQALREGGHTERLHTVPHHLDASVAKHSWNMAVLLLTLRPGAPRELIIACLLHDVAERWVGDTPAPAKYGIMPELGNVLHAAESRVERVLDIMQVELGPVDKRWLKALDILELVMHASDELAMGNHHIKVTLTNAWAILEGGWVPEEIRRFADDYSWQRTSDLIEGDKVSGTMERLTDEQREQR